MPDYLTNQMLIILIIIAVMLFIFYFIINYIYNKYLLASSNLDKLSTDMTDLSQEISKIKDISQKAESKISQFISKSESKSEVSTTKKNSWETFSNLFPASVDVKLVMAELFERDPEAAQKILQKAIEKRSKESQDYMYR